jgi:tetratricopeptide (TPR) repeat protein
MASIIKDYIYDIFISYRQKDNKYDGWVTEFVENLKRELEATFKEEISVYFDINPHDGLLETHDVDESLKDKLKCLVFIPIISRTYCDPKSFAWEHEFKAFVEQASNDRFGLKVKLSNGNVANRVLPIYIHDLDTADQKMCEGVLGGILRGVDFIYKAPGVNRPLRPVEENPHDNLNHTIYRDQVNKVANAIDEILRGMSVTDLTSVGKASPGESLKQETEEDKSRQVETFKSGKISFVKDLVERRVPHILAAYIIAGIIIVELVNWLVKQYPISPHLVSFCFVTLAAMIPAVTVLAYFHGRPGSSGWSMTEKIGIPSNLLLAIFLLFFLFQGRDLGATTTTVSLVDEQGKKIEREIPKSEFRKRLIVFSMDNVSGESDLDWLANALPDMLRYDLSQDIYLNIISVYDVIEDLRDEGYRNAVAVPMTLQKKIAAEKYMDYFTTGQIRKQNGLPAVTLSLHDTKTTKQLADNTFTGGDIFKLIDEMSVWLKNTLEIPETHIANTADLPVAEIMTGSVPALKSLYHGLDEYVLEDKREEGLELIREASVIDTTFAYAYIRLYVFNLYNTRMEEAMQALMSVMKYLHKLPEHNRFSVKHDYYYQIKQDPKMSMDVARNWAELYPDDIQAHEALAMRYMILNQKDNELAEYRQILSLDPGQYDYLLRIGDISRDLGRFEEAQKYYQMYTEEFPDHSKSYMRLGRLYFTYGDFEQARTYYNKALVIEPGDISIQLALTSVSRELGEFSKVLGDLDDLLENSTSPQERYQVYSHMEDYFFLRAQLDKGIKAMELKIAEQEKYDDPVNILSNRIDATERYVKAGKNDKAMKIMEDIEKQLIPPFDYLIPLGYLFIYLELEDKDNIDKYLPVVEEYTEERELWIYQLFVFYVKGRLNELEGDYNLALQEYEKAVAREPVNKSLQYYIARCYRMMNDYKKAESHLLDLLRVHPCWPEELSEMGYIYADWGKEDKAIEYLQKALGVWENADPGYKPARQAAEKLAELESTVK